MKKTKTSVPSLNKTFVIFGAVVIVVLAGFLLGWGLHPATVGDCTSLSLSQGSSSGAAGTIYKNAVITNTGSDTCNITGYPGVFMQDGSGMQVGRGAAANSLYGASKVTLAPGGKAHTVVAFPQQPNFPADTCSPIGSSMKLYVPGLAAALVAPWSDYSCPGFSATAIQAGE